jgi:uncharacterized protein YkwD
MRVRAENSNAFCANLAVGFWSPADVMNAWQASLTHAATMLNPKYTRVGIGRCHETWGILFGR